MSRTRDQFRSIIVPVDGSRLAEGAIPYALAIAERAGSTVRFVLVHPGHYPPLLIEPPKVYLKELTNRFRKRLGRSLSSIILNGAVAPSLVRHAREIKADLVVMTTHGHGGLRRAWLGSVTDQMIRSLEVPVLAVRAAEGAVLPESVSISEILVPLDGSPLAESVLEPTVELARSNNAKISLLQVVQPVFLAAEPGLPYPAGYDEQLTIVQREAAQDYLQDIVEQLRRDGVDATGIAVLGRGTADTILNLARPARVSLVALATHGRGGFRRLVLGSVADRLVRGSDVPILVIPPPRKARRPATTPSTMRALTLAEEVAYV